MDSIFRQAALQSLLVAAFMAGACGGGDAPSSGGMGGRGGAASGTGGAAGGGAATLVPTIDCPTFDIMPTPGTFAMDGACGATGRATATATTYNGTEDLVVWGEAGLGLPVCVIRFDVKRVGDGPTGCTNCEWTQLLEYSNPRMMTDVNGACANSGFGLTSEKIARINGCRVALGYYPTCNAAHGRCRMKYSVATRTWVEASLVTYCSAVEATQMMCMPANEFRYESRDGACRYQ